MFESWPELWGGGYPAYRTTLRKFLWFRTVTGGNAPEYDTVIGRIVSFITRRAAPLKIEASLSPIQDLHGYDNPWPGGGMGNIFDEANATVYNRWFNTSINTWATASDSTSYAFECEPDTDYVVSCFNTAATLFRVGYITESLTNMTENGPQIYSITRMTASGSVQIHTGNDATYIVMQLPKSMGSTHNAKVFINLGTTVPSTYSPYSNECPISGHTGADVWDDPKHGGLINFNQFVKNGNFTNSTNNWFGTYGNIASQDNILTYTITTIGSAYYTNIVAQAGFTIPKDHVVFICADTYAPYSNGFYMSMRNTNIGMSGIGISNVAITPNTWNSLAKVTKLTNNLTDIAFYWSMNTTYQVGDSVKVKNVMVMDLTEMFGETKANEIYAMGQGVNSGGAAYIRTLLTKEYYDYTASPVETCVSAVNGDPYEHVTISFGQTVYGGSLVVNEDGTGTVVVDDDEANLGNLNWEYDESYHRFRSYSLNGSIKPGSSARRSVLVCSIYQCISDGRALASVPDMSIYDGGNGYIYVHDSRYSDAATFKTAMSGVQLVYPLATPIIIQLSDSQVNALQGQNVVWVDDSDEIKVTYRSN